jgi:hypothetical protein
LQKAKRARRCGASECDGRKPYDLKRSETRHFGGCQSFSYVWLSNDNTLPQTNLGVMEHLYNATEALRLDPTFAPAICTQLMVFRDSKPTAEQMHMLETAFACGFPFAGCL